MLRKSRYLLISACALLSVLGLTERVAFSQLRIVTYNTANGTFPDGQVTEPRTVDRSAALAEPPLAEHEPEVFLLTLPILFNDGINS